MGATSWSGTGGITTPDSGEGTFASSDEGPRSSTHIHHAARPIPPRAARQSHQYRRVQPRLPRMRLRWKLLRRTSWVLPDRVPTER